VTAALREPDGTPTDGDLLRQIGAGQVAPLGVLFDRYAATVHGFARRVAPREDADDIVQETFLRISRVAETYEARSTNARAWIFGVAFAIVRERRRAVARFVRALHGLAGREASRTVAPIGAARAEIERCLDALTPEKREVVVLTEVMGMTGPEAAEVLGIPVSTVWMRLHHARRELRAMRGGADG